MARTFLLPTLNNIDQGGVGGGDTMVPNLQGGSPVSKKVQNSEHVLSKIVGNVAKIYFILGK